MTQRSVSPVIAGLFTVHMLYFFICKTVDRLWKAALPTFSVLCMLALDVLRQPTAGGHATIGVLAYDLTLEGGVQDPEICSRENSLLPTVVKVGENSAPCRPAARTLVQSNSIPPPAGTLSRGSIGGAYLLQGYGPKAARRQQFAGTGDRRAYST